MYSVRSRERKGVVRYIKVVRDKEKAIEVDVEKERDILQEEY